MRRDDLALTGLGTTVVLLGLLQHGYPNDQRHSSAPHVPLPSSSLSSRPDPPPRKPAPRPRPTAAPHPPAHDAAAPANARAAVAEPTGPPAILLFAPHKTGSTFFAAFLHDLSKQLELCWYTDNAAFMYWPKDFTKCASPSCAHPGQQKSFSASDRGWGDCNDFTSARIREASGCLALGQGRTRHEAAAPTGGANDTLRGGGGSSIGGGKIGSGSSGSGGSSGDGGDGGDGDGACATSQSARHGLLWGPLRLPLGMNAARGLLSGGAWRWRVVLHQRHPLDTLVSGYHSFGWTHPAAPGATAQQRREHDARQAAVRNLTVDQYCLANAAELRRKYAPYLELLRAAETPSVRLVRSRYEEMVTAFPRWLEQLLDALMEGYYPAATRAKVLAKLTSTHAGAFRPDGKHKRSVSPGRFRRELKPETIATAAREHAEWFGALGYGEDTAPPTATP